MLNIPVVDKDGNIKREMNLEEKWEAVTPEELLERVRGYTHRQLLALYDWWRDNVIPDHLYSWKELGDTIDIIKGEILHRMEGNKAILIPNADCGEYEVELHIAALEYE